MRSQRDTVSPFNVTNAEAVTSLDANTTTDTVQNNATAAIVLALQKQGILTGSVSSGA